jgi:hypothetical protein
MLTPATLVRATPELLALLALLALLSRISMTMDQPVHTEAAHSCEQQATRSSKANTTSTPVTLVLMVRATPELETLPVLLPRFAMTMELSAHTAAAHSSEQQATPRSMVSTISEVTLAPLLVLLLQELLVVLLQELLVVLLELELLVLLLAVLLPRASVMMTELPAHTAAAHSCELKKATPRSMVSMTSEVTLAPPVLLVKELLLQELLELLVVPVPLPRASMTMRELSAHTAAAHSSEQQATPHSMVSTTSEVTLAPPVMVHFQTKTHH